MYQSNKKPAVWNDLKNFSVSDNGAIKPSGDGYEGKPCFLTLDAAQHILDNQDSFRKAIEMAKEKTLRKEIGNELNKLTVQFIKAGLSPEEAAQAVESILAKKKQVQTA